jgi:hypothetical protein
VRLAAKRWDGRSSDYADGHQAKTRAQRLDKSAPTRHDQNVARTTVTQITDDLDGSKDATEVAFSFDGVDYTIDLSKKNAAAMAKALKPYLDAATKVTRRASRARRAGSSRAAGPRKDLAAVREWARGQGLEVSDRGRVPAAVVEQYDAAH